MLLMQCALCGVPPGSGLHGLLERVHVASEQVLMHYSLKQALSSDGVLQLLKDIQLQTAQLTSNPQSPLSLHVTP